MQSVYKTFRCLSARKVHISSGNWSKIINEYSQSNVAGHTFSKALCSRRNYGTEIPIRFPSAKDFFSLDEEKKRKLIEMELEIYRQSGEFHVPSGELSEKNWQELITFNSATKRKKYYKYLKSIEVAIENKKAKSEAIAVKIKEKVAESQSNPHIVYGLWNNSLTTKIVDSTMVKFYNYNLIHAAMFGQKFVIDMGYDGQMNSREVKSLCRQLQMLYAANKTDKDPFHLHLCNMPPEDSALTTATMLALPQLQKENGLTVVTQKSYLDLFPSERLIYLTPDCRRDLIHYNHDDVYIIGGLVNLGPSRHLFRAKAKREGLRMARLPFERYLDWGGGNKILPLDQLMKILLMAKNTGDWRKAFENVAKRKLRRIYSQDRLTNY